MADKSATEILQNTSKAFVGFETALRVARERLEGAAHAEQLAEAATREGGAGRGGGGGAAAGAGGRAEAEKATRAGEVAELRAQKDQLAADVARLAGAKVALAPHA